MLLKDRVAIVTGAAVGMGKGTALKFAEEGCEVAIVDINLEAAEATAEETAGLGTKGFALKCDVTDIDQVKTTVDQVIDRCGKVDILMNNVGAMSETPPVEDITEQEWDQAYQLNLKSGFFFSKYVVPVMKKRKYGKIINLSSIGAVQPPHHVAHYNSAKSAMIGFTLDLASSLAGFGINVNTILPGPVRTEFYNRYTKTMTDGEKDDFFNAIGKKVPLQRIGMPEDIANAALFLASGMSSFITGQVLYVAGGLPLLTSIPSGE